MKSEVFPRTSVKEKNYLSWFLFIEILKTKPREETNGIKFKAKA